MNQTSKDFFSKHHNSGSGTIIRNQKKSNNNTLLLGVFAVLLVLIVAAYFLLIKPGNLEFWSYDTSQETYLLGESITAEGSLVASGDIVTYTHVLETPEHEILLLKSKTIPLNNYSNHLSGLVQIMGRVETFHNNYPLIEVTMIWGDALSDIETDLESRNEGILPGTYVQQAGIYFPPQFFDSYTFVGDNSGEKMLIKNLENDKETRIDFFQCTDQGNTNCKQLLKTFEGNTERTIINTQGISFRKLTEVNSRFFHNENRWGYFINDADFVELDKIKDLIVLPDQEYLKNLVNLYGTKVCLGNNAWISSITSHEVKQGPKGLTLILQGSGENLFECIVEVDLTLPNKLKFVDLKMTANPSLEPTNTAKDEEKDTEINKEPEVNNEKDTKDANQKSESEVTLDTTRNPNVTQFPINKDKSMNYTSSRGAYMMSFPSSNISFSALSKDQNFDQVGVQCNYGIHVIKFSDKEQLESDPAIIVYECSAKNDINLPGEQYLLKELWEKKFLIHVRDGAWLDFARNIDISMIE